MKFTHKIVLYKVNEDNTVTFYIPQGENEKSKYFRASARLKLLVELSEMPQDTELLVNIGVYYDKQLKLQIIDLVQ